MAIYDNLPVFKEAYSLLLSLYEVSKNLSRDYRYTIGEELKKRTMEVILCIYKANSVQNEEKLPYLNRARECMVEIKLHIRLLHDLKQIQSKRLAGFIVKAEIISKQLTAWSKYSKNNSETIDKKVNKVSK